MAKEPGEPRELTPEDLKDMRDAEKAEYSRECHFLSEKVLKNRIETLKDQLDAAETELMFRERNKGIERASDLSL